MCITAGFIQTSVAGTNEFCKSAQSKIRYIALSKRTKEISPFSTLVVHALEKEIFSSPILSL
jgi:hypothetical protein